MMAKINKNMEVVSIKNSEEQLKLLDFIKLVNLFSSNFNLVLFASCLCNILSITLLSNFNYSEISTAIPFILFVILKISSYNSSSRFSLLNYVSNNLALLRVYY